MRLADTTTAQPPSTAPSMPRETASVVKIRSVLAWTRIIPHWMRTVDQPGTASLSAFAISTEHVNSGTLRSAWPSCATCAVSPSTTGASAKASVRLSISIATQPSLAGWYAQFHRAKARLPRPRSESIPQERHPRGRRSQGGWASRAHCSPFAPQKIVTLSHPQRYCDHPQKPRGAPHPKKQLASSPGKEQVSAQSRHVVRASASVGEVARAANAIASNVMARLRFRDSTSTSKSWWTSDLLGTECIRFRENSLARADAGAVQACRSAQKNARQRTRQRVRLPHAFSVSNAPPSL